MITSFFKPKTTKKVTPESSSSSSSNPNKRSSNDASGKFEDSPNKKLKSARGQTESVTELLSHLTKSDTESDEVTWHKILEKHSHSPSFASLAKFVSSQRKSHQVFPPLADTWSALNHTPLNKVKVVIVGQDPYHGENQAHGLCFSVRRGIHTPPSLRNIYKELVNDTMVDNFKHAPGHGNLERWAKQGVLMINTVMTVRKGEPNSHKKKGWEIVTDEILRAVDRRAKQNVKDGKKDGVVYLLWGKPATEKCQTALCISNISSSAQTHRAVICTSHPSPLGATKTNSPFTGSKCFSKVNQFLTEMGHEPIDWRVDNST